jgi:hypothetical protein
LRNRTPAVESLGAFGILCGAVGGVLWMAADDTGIRLAIGIAGVGLFFVGFAIAIVQSWRMTRRAEGKGLFRSFLQCLKRAFSFLFWMLP